MQVFPNLQSDFFEVKGQVYCELTSVPSLWMWYCCNAFKFDTHVQDSLKINWFYFSGQKSLWTQICLILVNFITPHNLNKL